MPIALGIDTGGTYTDGVVLDLETQAVLKKSKARTTRENLTIGISQCINNLGEIQVSDVRLVALSTTLATNAIVEGRGCRVGVILIGHEPIEKLPVEDYVVIQGGHDIKGKARRPLDKEEAREAIEDLAAKVDALAVSGYLSIRNPEHELEVARLIREVAKMPVVCAHQLTTSLGFHERTVTAALNARLIPIITELIVSIKEVLKERGIHAPLMIVKGNGSLMSERVAMEKPIETILSGPAASIVGATFLTNVEEALVLDMGGTTTDIALLENGVPQVNREGAMVGGWLTRVEAADISTFGAGGDSYLQVTADRELKVGPQRVWPVCYGASVYPYLVDELHAAAESDRELLFNQPTDCFILLRKGEVNSLTSVEKEIIKALEKGPHNLFYLSQMLDKDPNFLAFQRLENLGIVARMSVTPTDILHATGVYTNYNTEAAKIATSILADRMGMAGEDFLETAMEAVINKLCLAVLQSLVTHEGRSIWLEDNEGCAVFLDKILGKKKESQFGCQVSLAKPIVAIGAPVRAYLPAVAEKLHTQLIIPENAEVANAVGAATGKVVESVKVLIKPGAEGGFIVHLPYERKAFIHLEDATEYALQGARQWVAELAQKAGADDAEIMVEHEHVYSKTATNWQDEVYLETRIEVTAVGRPRWENGNPDRETLKQNFI